jgi:NADPH:quinone reductase-like Zn-dependent oxidoreductase
MKALTLHRYGNPQEVLMVEEVVKPTPQPHQVLVRIKAAALNDYDWSMVTGKPYLYRLLFGLRKPRNPIPGMELAGTVEAIGSQVQHFQVGDDVFGDTSAVGFGTCAEYMCLDEKALLKKPEHMAFEEAAALPHAFGLAWQGLMEKGQLAEGQKILINGGGGGVGTLGVQLAKMHNCEVSGIDTGAKLLSMKAVGFDHVLDYKAVNFTKNHTAYDLILDCKTNHSPLALLRALKPGGRYITVGGKPGRLIQLLLLGKWIGLLSSKTLKILSLVPNRGLEHSVRLFSANKLKPILDGTYTLKEGPKLLQYFGEGKHFGKVVLTIPD